MCPTILDDLLLFIKMKYTCIVLTLVSPSIVFYNLYKSAALNEYN